MTFLLLSTLLFFLWLPTPLEGQGQVPLPDPRRERVKNTLAGVYSENITLFYRNSPYRVVEDLTVEVGATMYIETGVQIYFDTGVGLRIKGSIIADGNEFAHIQMLPYQEQIQYDDNMPEMRLIDGPNVRMGRLQWRFRDRWRSVCTQLTNWTQVDVGSACRTMGYGDGGFWKWFRRNNDTYPLVLSKPDCYPGAKTLLDCPGLADENRIPLSENLCQGEDDLGIICWGPPTFQGWAKHWKGLSIFNSPFSYVNADNDMVSVQRESASRLEHLDILYAGYDGSTKNVTAALWIEGVPPIMNGLRIEHSARDGLYLYESAGPIIIANSTFSYNRGHGIAVDQTTDARFFVNMTRVEGNWGDGVWYKQYSKGAAMIPVNAPSQNRKKRQNLFEEEKPRADMCRAHFIPSSLFFPHLLSAHMQNGSIVDPSLPLDCWMVLSLPPRLDYTYSFQFLSVVNRNPPQLQSTTSFIVCDTDELHSACTVPKMKIPLIDGKLPQSVSIKSSSQPLYLGIEHKITSGTGYLAGDVDLLFRVHASVKDKAFYGLNITNSIISHNIGNGVLGVDLRDRTALHNVTLEENQGQAGFLVREGAADIWLNDTRLIGNWGDGMNVSYAGGSINLNGTTVTKNRWRGVVVHYNESSPFLAMHYEFIFKGRPSNNIFYVRSFVSENLWGGVLIGNFCIPVERKIDPKFLITWVEFVRNQYHPAVEIHSCQSSGMARSIVDISGNRIEGNNGMGLRLAPAVNLLGVVTSNQFLNNNDTALFVKNSPWPQLSKLSATLTISRNAFKFNRGKYIVSIGLNEDAPGQFLNFNQQNEVRSNTVIDPYPLLNARSSPSAALVVTSSNVKIHKNCFQNRDAQYEIATELSEHAKEIDARENHWGSKEPRIFMDKIFDQFYRYSLASIEISPYAVQCNERSSHSTPTLDYFRQFREESRPFQIGGTVYENYDLPLGTYHVTSDLHIIPGAILTVEPGSVFQFNDGIGMLVQGELVRPLYGGDEKSITFTARPFELQQIDNVRLVDDDGNSEVIMGRVEVLVDNEWGSVCNRSWTAFHAQMVCNRLGLVMDPQYFENWRIFPSRGELPMVMDNIRCEENEVDITRCRHDGVRHNIAAGCRATEIVGIRCAEPRWAGVRYSLLANPPTVTGQRTMHNWKIEKAGVFDFRVPEFSAALQIDWNYHTFRNLEIRDNFWNGIDVIYNDLTKKPAIRNSVIQNNRKNGMRIRSAGITIENVTLTRSGEAGLRYDPSVTGWEQKDIVSWLSPKEQPDADANNVYYIPSRSVNILTVFESQLNNRKFLVAVANEECPLNPSSPCSYEIIINATGDEYGMASKMAVQIVNPTGNETDEDAILMERGTGKSWSVRKDNVRFPITTSENSLVFRYTRSRGQPKMILLFIHLDTQEYLDRFIHLYESRVENNAYGISAVHYSNSSFVDGTLTNRYDKEKLWFQKVNFTRNSESVIWIHSPQHQVLPGTPIVEITYHLDNCSLVENGGVIESHRDSFASANVFNWNIWSNTFANNSNTGFAVRLPDTYDLLSNWTHQFRMTENRFENNTGLRVLLDGYYAFANISSNNFTDNWAPERFGILEVAGMEKELVMERNRFFMNWGTWMVRTHITSHSLRSLAGPIPAFIQYNYLQFNHFVKKKEEYVDMWPRSYAIGCYGSQKIDVHFNRVKNDLLDFEMVTGGIPLRVDDSMNVTHNWWGAANEALIAQRIFDVDDWNTFTMARYSPFFVTEEHFINFWWNPSIGQLASADHIEPSVDDLKGRMYESKTLTLVMERWNNFPRDYKPFRPYRITRDLTIMPGATLTIADGVEVHIWPNVRILVLGDLVANGTYWNPIRFKPINTTEYDEIKGRIGTRYKRSTMSELNGVEDDLVGGRWVEGGGPFVRELEETRRVRSSIRTRNKRSDIEQRIMKYLRRKRAAFDRKRADDVYRAFPVLKRDDPFYQKFEIQLDSTNSTRGPRAGFVQALNATTGEVIPLCDRQFTIRNAMVVCRQLGMDTPAAQHWVTPQWEYNPRLRLVKTYVEPRECRGEEMRLDDCPLRLTGNDSQWMCIDNEHFNYVHCGNNRSLSSEYIGNWGGITFAHDELDVEKQPYKDSSLLLNVEIVGGGYAHNDSLQSAGLQLFFRSPIVSMVNVTNSSLHALQVISPRDRLILNHLNITDNLGQGVHILTMNLQATGPASADAPLGPLTIPYLSPGMINMCASTKKITVDGRVVVYYKYDSRPVDCVKLFVGTGGRKLSFRFLKVNMYSSFVDLGRPDSLRVYASSTFNPAFLLGDFRAPRTAQSLYTTLEAAFTWPSLSTSVVTSHTDPLSAEQMALHLRASAADGIYGFIAEIAALPATPEAHPIEEVAVKASRIERNDQGGLSLVNIGEISPDVIVEDCSFARNGLLLYGNVSTSMQAVEMRLHNTQRLLIRGSSFVENRGGLLIAARSASAVIRLSAVVKNNLFSRNSNSTALAFFGNDYQTVLLLNNIITNNYALYFDTVLVESVALNSTRNVFSNNTGLHTVETRGHSRVAQDGHTFYRNIFTNNIALGHGHQYQEHYGYLPEDSKWSDEFQLRPKRQVISQSGVSFDWWTHVGEETERYRSTILAGSSQQHLTENVFNNPGNDYELTTTKHTQYDIGVIDAKNNYWGYPGTESVAAGKIRDQVDYSYLIRVEYRPVLESNQTLVDGECPGGWWMIGDNEFKSCYIFVGAAATYQNALEYCESMDAFIPYFQAEDKRRKQLAARVDDILATSLTDMERYQGFSVLSDTPFWVSSVDVPSIQCGVLSSRTGRINYVNCNGQLPFVCERGAIAYSSPPLWRGGVLIAILIVVLLLALLFLLCCCWFWKARRRRSETIERKNIIRASMQLQKKNLQYAQQKRFEDAWGSSHESAKGSIASTPMDAAPLYQKQRQPISGPMTVRSPTETLHTTCSDSLSTDQYYHSSRSDLYSNAVCRSPKKKLPKSNNPYAEIPNLTGYHPSKPGDIRIRDMQHGRGRDATTADSSCSTCVSDSESCRSRDSYTAESESSMRSSSVSSEGTITQAEQRRPSVTTFTSPARPVAPTPRAAAAAAAAAAAVPYAAPTSTQRYAPTAPAAPVSQPPQQRVPSPPQHQQQDPFRRENSYAQSMPRRAAPPPPTRSTTNLRGSQTSLSAAAVSNLAASALARSNPNLYEQPLDRSPRRPGVAALAAPAAAPAAARSLVSLNPPSEVLYRSGRDVFRHDDEDEETLVETSM
ncbi:hypothetical protein PFISCL1PPCAC_1545 [Pristionchus fissidentatus]|uniref:SRCR domain-containing protein n=1 Tax=Pristionchus fissidentatus TaxID=1538716 RepID=A0AAV5UU84_9BILA|nr:hypothetical protein PFISCL1PPCAC_1545 [Pristionchus fissidentatus]